MTERTRTLGTFCWSELGTRDTAAAERFYTGLFAWKVEEHDMPGDMGGKYGMLRLGQDDVGGMYQLAGPMCEGVPSHWMHYVQVADVDAQAEQAQQLGGKIIAPPMEIPDIGRMAVIEDPTGAKLALFETGAHQGATADPLEPGAFCWFELQTRDPESAATFYGKLFGWKTKRGSDGMPYTEFTAEGASQPHGGMLKLDEHMGDVPPHWIGYVTVTDCDATARKATQLGGTLCVPPMDIPDVGRFGVVADPTGALVAFVTMLPNPQ